MSRDTIGQSLRAINCHEAWCWAPHRKRRVMPFGEGTFWLALRTSTIRADTSEVQANRLVQDA